jgi:hypothetical protein
MPAVAQHIAETHSAFVESKLKFSTPPSPQNAALAEHAPSKLFFLSEVQRQILSLDFFRAFKAATALASARFVVSSPLSIFESNSSAHWISGFRNRCPRSRTPSAAMRTDQTPRGSGHIPHENRASRSSLIETRTVLPSNRKPPKSAAYWKTFTNSGFASAPSHSHMLI